MLRVIVILGLVMIGLVGLAVAAIGLAFKLIGAVFWIGLALAAYLLWSRSRRAS